LSSANVDKNCPKGETWTASELVCDGITWLAKDDDDSDKISKTILSIIIIKTKTYLK